MSLDNNEIYLKRSDILDGAINCSDSRPEQKRKAIEEYVSLYVERDVDDRNEIISMLFREFQRRWQRANRKKDQFLKLNEQWLSQYIVFGIATTSSASKNVGGRPTKKFEDASDRSKRRKTEILRKSFTSQELKFAAGMALQAEGNVELATMLRKGSGTTSMPIEQALAIYVDARLSKRRYNIIREPVKNYYPSYDKIAMAKSECFPPLECLEISETVCKAQLQALLNHTCSRLTVLVQQNLEQLAREGRTEFSLLVKWGCDGSSGFNEYKQKFIDPSCTDAHVFLTSLVPLRLITDKKVVWDNPRSSSTRYCRPVCLKFAKETIQVARDEYERMSNEIASLEPFELTVSGYKLLFNFELMLTMIDGKTVNAITDTKSSQRCYLCYATSSNFNNISDMISRAIISDNLEYGMSSLHCWIRTFECLLHIAYRLTFRKWIKTGHMEEYNNAKARIQKLFFEQLGLHVDKPRAKFGNSNDGNTARSFFKNAEISSQITGIDLDLIVWLRTILQAISCGESVDAEKFRLFAQETAKRYVSLYGWYNMPTTLHKLLIHGSEIINKALLPIGRLSEEAQEAMNKEIRRLREHHAWKGCRKQTMQDIFCGLLVASDPVVSSYRHGQTIVADELPKEVQDLLTNETLDE